MAQHMAWLMARHDTWHSELLMPLFMAQLAARGTAHGMAWLTTPLMAPHGTALMPWFVPRLAARHGSWHSA